MNIDTQALNKLKKKSLENISQKKESMHCTILLPVYNEASRIHVVKEKVQDLEHLRKISEDSFDWEIVLSDDGSTDNTAEKLDSMVKSFPLSIQEKIHYTQLPQDLQELKQQTAHEKVVCMGGGILNGLKYIEENITTQYVVYSDCDASVPLWQIGLFWEDLYDECELVIGSRREKDSLVFRDPRVLSSGKKFIHVWSQLFPEVAKVTLDVHGALHFIRSDKVAELVQWLEENEIYNVAFKLGWSIYAIQNSFTVKARGMIFIDDYDGSHFGGTDARERLKPHAGILLKLVSFSQNMSLKDQLKDMNTEELVDYLMAQ